MKIRVKIILVVLPIIILSLSLYQRAVYSSARLGITRIAQSFLHFKASELQKFAEGQWNLLVENNFAGRPDMVEAAKKAVLLYAQSIILSDTEIIFALDENGEIAITTSPLEIRPAEMERLSLLLAEENPGIFHVELGGIRRVFTAFYFTPFRWHVLLTEKEVSFYQDVNRIRFQTLVALAAASAVAVLMLVFFARTLTKPLERVVSVMNDISSGAELSSRVEMEFEDETGKLALAFNQMISELQKAYAHIKSYAFEAVLAGKKEQRIRQIFQKYVPKDLIDKFFASPESMLVGENRELTILFSDIRSFTAISEKMAPDDLVNSLNRYFSEQVNIIMNRNGIVDKYIGDAIMALWGAPVKHKDDALQALLSGLAMIEAVKIFNKDQNKLGKPEFQTGIGINYGVVTVGNIGCDRKMDYTVIGDAVNLASRMEGLTKNYQVDILISEYLYDVINSLEDVKELLPSFRLLDSVAVKGKTRGVKIYTAKTSLSADEKKAWDFHNQGMTLYYQRNFAGAAKFFQGALNLIPGDYNAEKLLQRCKVYTSAPPPPDWNGVEVMHTK